MASLILRLWRMDPLRCPVQQNPTRAIAAIDERCLPEKNLRHLGGLARPAYRAARFGHSGTLDLRTV